jgi:AcrR family transcriptional regulator
VDKATTLQIAHQAGVAEGTIYRHFPSKAAFIEAVFARAWDRLNHDLNGRLPSREDPETRLRAYLGTALAVMGSHPEETALLRVEFAYLVGGTRGGCPVPAGSKRFIAILEDAIRLAQSAGKARPGLDPSVSAAFIYNGVSKTWATLGDGFDALHAASGIQGFLDAALFP